MRIVPAERTVVFKFFVASADDTAERFIVRLGGSLERRPVLSDRLLNLLGFPRSLKHPPNTAVSTTASAGSLVRGWRVLFDVWAVTHPSTPGGTILPFKNCDGVIFLFESSDRASMLAVADDIQSLVVDFGYDWSAFAKVAFLMGGFGFTESAQAHPLLSGIEVFEGSMGIPADITDVVQIMCRQALVYAKNFPDDINAPAEA